MIPNIAHTIWVGGNNIPEKEAYCISKNSEMFNESGYIFKIWGDKEVLNFTEIYPELKIFFNSAYEQKKYAFISDCAKALILTHYGGWVLDADNEIIKSLSPFQRMNWVSGFENWQGNKLPITALMGGCPYHSFSQLLLRHYLEVEPEILFSMPNTRWISEILFENKMNSNDKRQYLDSLDVEIFPSDYFCGPEITNNTFALHHFSASWIKNEN